MEYYNSFHTISEFIKQGKGRLLVDRQRLHNAYRDVQKGKKSRLLQLMKLSNQNNVMVEEYPTQELQGLLDHYRGYILALEPSQGERANSVNDILLQQPNLVLLLDGILDVGNLGAIVRSADLFGAAAVFVSHRSARHNQLGRAAAGANVWVPIIQGNLAQIAQQLQRGGYWLYGADIHGEEAARTQFQQPCAVLLGAEEHGISTHLRGLCDTLVCIPTTGHIDSLNVSAAGAVLLYEIKCQWRHGRQNRPAAPSC